ncbi:uncharacterized protein N0V89_008119 [Didymosphaeria variabile]|uniref:F-box domain-containing protein n=1 Tax=Didymosphaeria variabile TaxID=1932322 RepID=A0A9W8XFM8_9PLEO|nr:uncharacterized protein N0V89_008119 [Didymosphaeria variabile]KAJ4349503.1 hypothetical protein N0V89_008119 [Didymosphaeria variabile]
MAPPSTKRKGASDSKDASDSPAKRIRTVPEGGPVQRKRDIFPFLDLPGELRNRIYDILAADANENPVGIRNRLREIIKEMCDRLNIRKEPKQLEHGFSHSSWGLTQVCRKIRDEYLPVLRPMRRVCVTINDLEKYMDVFVPRLDDNMPFLRAPTTVEIIQNSDHVSPLDLHLISQWIHASPNLNFIFDKDLIIASQIVELFSAWNQIGQALGLRGMTLHAPPKSAALYGVLCWATVDITCNLLDGSPPFAHSLDEERLVHITHFAHAAGFFSSPNERLSPVYFEWKSEGTAVLCFRLGPSGDYSLNVVDRITDFSLYRIPSQGVKNTEELRNCRLY